MKRATLEKNTKVRVLQAGAGGLTNVKKGDEFFVAQAQQFYPGGPGIRVFQYGKKTGPTWTFYPEELEVIGLSIDNLKENHKIALLEVDEWASKIKFMTETKAKEFDSVTYRNWRLSNLIKEAPKNIVDKIINLFE